ncbi:hypothetical protein QJS04_geneDACA005368 [Acorus gramineus]|uniref:Pre-mRNA polyadenylation factor Fip1 domain-containing protein n=1 Tax=Acorus gramineus TaxID=55184 RepID=A0AAV9AZA1_ACOGR|nr:hypothetical protein QJS04_geneDACA005368 [Acorus gramineus]
MDMEDDDEFGDLYTDVLPPISSAPPPPPPPLPLINSSAAAKPPRPSVAEDVDDDYKILFGAPPHRASSAVDVDGGDSGGGGGDDGVFGDGIETGTLEDEGARVSVVSPRLGRGGGEIGVLEDGGGVEEETIIPGLSRSPLGAADDSDVNAAAAGAGDLESDDSEDDLQIVLNETRGPIGLGLERKRRIGGSDDDEDDDDEDEEDLVIVADDGDQHNTPMMNEQEWGEEVAQQPGMDGERKDGVEATKVNGAIGVAARSGGHGYHPLHMQYKYVRPVLAAAPGSAATDAGGAPGQVRPPAMGFVPGRGRGDWRPMGPKNIPYMQKNFHSGHGAPTWGNNSSGRAFGGGMDFTLPSHKTVFDIDIDCFEDKPWRHPGVDRSDFFNFGLDEENWKDYCKQLVQLRLEATMQSRIRVYESGRSEQEYDPDLPPELAVAAGLQDMSTETAHIGKEDGAQVDMNGQGRRTAWIHPQLPTGRAIQVESGSGSERPLRQTRMRDSDAVIEVSVDESITSNSELGQPGNGSQKEDFDGGDEIEEDDAQPDPKYCDRYLQSKDGGDILLLPSGEAFPYDSNARCRSTADSGGIFDSPCRGSFRSPQGIEHERQSIVSGDTMSNQISRGDGEDGLSKDKSGDIIEEIRTAEVSSPLADETLVDLSLDQVDDLHEDDDSLVAGEEIDFHDSLLSETDFVKKQKLSFQVKTAVQDHANSDDLRITQSDTSEGISGSNRDYQKHHEGGEVEVVQDSRPRNIGDMMRHHDEDEHGFRQNDDYDRDSKQEFDKSRTTLKQREEHSHSYPHKDLDSASVLYVHDKEMNIGSWQRREEDAHGKRLRDDDARRERGEDTGLRSRGKEWLNDRNGKNRVDDVDRGGFYDKDAGRHESFNDLCVKRRRDEESQRRERADKDDVLYGYRGREDVGQRKREREDANDPRRRDDIARLRDKPDNHHPIRHRDDGWRQREREDRQRFKRTHEDMLLYSKREGRGGARSVRVLEEKLLVGNARMRDESKGFESNKDYKHREKRRQNEQHKRRDRVEKDSLSKGHEDLSARDSQSNHEERRISRHERSPAHNSRAFSLSDDQKTYRESSRGNTRKGKEFDDGDQSTSSSSRRKQDHDLHRMEKVGKGMAELLNNSNVNSWDNGQKRSSSTVLSKKSRRHHHGREQHGGPQQHNSPLEENGEVASDDGRATRGRSKFERWLGHGERDYNTNVESSPPSTRAKEAFIENQVDETTDNTVGVIDSETRDAHAGPVTDALHVDTDKLVEDHHLDTVEKLKKRSERFKLPLPIEKDITANKKVETEVLLPVQIEVCSDSQIKQERPARKRRWVSG